MADTSRSGERTGASIQQRVIERRHREQHVQPSRHRARQRADGRGPRRLRRAAARHRDRSSRSRHPRARQRDHRVRRARGRRPGRGPARRDGDGPAHRPVVDPGVRAAVADDAASARGRAPGPGAHPEHPVQPWPHDPTQDPEPEALRRRDRREHHRLRDRPGRHRQDLPRDGQGRAGAAEQAGQPHHPDPAGGRGGGAARVPARDADGEDRPLPAAALRRAARHDRPRVDPAPDPAGHHRGRAAGLHAGPHAQRLVHHPRRGAEHLARADEDVPHPARVRLADGRHRRRHADRPAGWHDERPADRARDPRRHRRRGVPRAHRSRRRAPPAGREDRRRLRPLGRRPGRPSRRGSTGRSRKGRR